MAAQVGPKNITEHDQRPAVGVAPNPAAQRSRASGGGSQRSVAARRRLAR